MRKLLIILITIFPRFLAAQWVSTDINGYINASSFLNQDTFLVNTNNSLLKTENGGQTFVTLSNYPPQSSYNIFYKSIDTIFSAQTGAKGLLKSSDAGNTWTTQTLLMPNGDTAFKSKAIFFFGFFDQNNGIIIGDTLNGQRQVFLSDDGGLSWTFYQNPSIDSIHFKITSQVRKAPYISKSGNLRMIINAKILFIANYGRQWSMDTSTSNMFITDFVFKDNDTGFAFINEKGKPNFFKTTDGGLSWVINPRDTSYKLEGGRLIYAKGDGDNRSFILSPTSNINGLTNISYDEGYSWHMFDTINHQSVYFYNSICGVSDLFGIGLTPRILRYDKNFTGLENLEKMISTRMVLYPNPAQNFVSFSRIFPSVQLWDLQGKLISSDENVNVLDISYILNGLYVIKVIDENQILAAQKLVIQH